MNTIKSWLIANVETGGIELPMCWNIQLLDYIEELFNNNNH